MTFCTPTHPLRSIAVITALTASTVLGCMSQGDSWNTGPGDPQDPTDPADTAWIADVQVEIHEITPTVATVTWSSDASGSPAVEFGLDGETDNLVLGRDLGDDRYDALIVGLKSDREYSYRVVMEGDEFLTTDVGTFTTGQLDMAAELSVVGEFPTQDRGLMVAVLVSDVATVVILDTDGEITWSHETDVVLGDKVETALFSASLTEDRRALLFEDQLPAPEGFALVKMDLVDRESTVLTSTDSYHHDFAVLPGGGVALMEGEFIEVDGQELRGDRIVEVDTDGAAHVVWSVWDDVEYDPEVFPWVEQMEFADFTHFNAIDHDPDQDAYFVSSFSLDALFKVDRDSGDLKWQLGGALTDLLPADAETQPFSGQHEFHPFDDRIVVMDNGKPGEQNWARVVEYELDPQAGTYRQIWEYTADPPLTNYTLGDVSRLPDGSTLVTWSEHGQIDLVSPQGELLWRLNTPLGTGIGYVDWVPAY